MPLGSATGSCGAAARCLAQGLLRTCGHRHLRLLLLQRHGHGYGYLRLRHGCDAHLGVVGLGGLDHHTTLGRQQRAEGRSGQGLGRAMAAVNESSLGDPGIARLSILRGTAPGTRKSLKHFCMMCKTNS